MLISAFPFQLIAADIKNDSLKSEGKKITQDSLTYIAKKRANKVAMMSALLPGLGQIANKKYWKVPIIYGGASVLTYFIISNNKEYNKYEDALIYRNDNDSTTVDNYPNYTNDDLTLRRDYYRRNRDLSYIFASVLYEYLNYRLHQNPLTANQHMHLQY